MGRADLHLHTTYSDGMGTVEAVLEAARRAGLDIIAITDHDTLQGALRGRDLGPRYGVGVIPGVEITTAEGHLLAYWVERPIPAGRPLIETLLRVGEQGGLCIAAHPTAQWVPSLGAAAIRRALRDADAARILVGIEVYNMGLPRLVNNRSAQALGQETGLAQVANTDSHMLWTIGLCATEFAGVSAQAVRRALEQHATRPLIGPRPAGFLPSWLSQWLMRLAGFGYWTPQPGGVITLRRLRTVQQTLQ
ncbi:MAG: PHP domain-containing protein [Anaerolineae bacterium]